MVAFVYRCPSTSLRVQGWVANDPSERDEKSYKARDLHDLCRNPLGQSEDR
jgi:hypothetical protein